MIGTSRPHGLGLKLPKRLVRVSILPGCPAPKWGGFGTQPTTPDYAFSIQQPPLHTPSVVLDVVSHLSWTLSSRRAPEEPGLCGRRTHVRLGLARRRRAGPCAIDLGRIMDVVQVYPPPRHSMGLPYMPTLTPFQPPQCTGNHIWHAWSAWVMYPL